MIPSGSVDFRSRPSRGDRSLNVEVEDVNLPPGAMVDVLVNDQAVGKIMISVAPVRGGELELNLRDGDFTPTLRPGDVVTLRTASGLILAGATQTRALDDVRRNPPPQTPTGTPSGGSATQTSAEARARTGLTGGPINGLTPSGHVDIRQRPGGDTSLTVEIEDVNLPLGTVVEIEVDGQLIGRIIVSGAGRGGELELNSRDGAIVPAIRSGASVVVRVPGRGAILSGVTQTLGAQPADGTGGSSPTTSPNGGGSNSGGAANNGEVRLRSPLAGGAVGGVRPSGHIDFRERPDRGDLRLNIEVEDVNLPAGTVLDVEIAGRVVGRITLNALRTGELELNTRDGAIVQRVRAGATVVVRAPARGAILSGVVQVRSIDETPRQEDRPSSSSSSNSSGNSGSGSSGNSGSGGSGNSGSGGSGNSGSGSSGNSGSGGSGNSGSGGSGNSGSGGSGSGGSGGSGSGGSGGSGSGGSGGSGNSGSGGSGGGKDDPPGHR